jgi:phosphatidylinositol glycan class B
MSVTAAPATEAPVGHAGVRRAILLFAALQIPAAFLSLGHHHPDEHFQILEFLNYTLGLTPAAALPWEFHEAIRPFVQIAAYYPVVLAERAVGITSPFAHEITLRAISALLGILAFASGLSYFARTQLFERRALLAMAGFAALPYLNARVSAETVGASVFFVGLFALLRGLDEEKAARAFAGALLLGLAFYIRFQLAFMLVGLGVWLVVERRILRDGRAGLVLPMAAGFMAGAFLATLADRWGYGRWVFTPWAYFDANILEDRAAQWGVSPWWDYLRLAVLRMMPPLGLASLGVVAWCLVRRPRSLLVWLVVPFLVGHSLVGHKEYRFLFPLALPVTFMLGMAVQSAAMTGWRLAAFRAFAAFNVIWLLVLPYRPASFEVGFYRDVYGRGIRDLYSIDGDPYTMAGLPVYFYRPAETRVHVIEPAAVEEVVADQPAWLFAKRLRPFDPGSPLEDRCQVEYRSVPLWAGRVNVNDWLSRVPIWGLYRCEP